MPLTNEERAEWRRRNRERRVLVEGRLVAAHLPTERHGRESARADHGCQCEPCTTAHSQRVSASSRKLRQARAKQRRLMGGHLVAVNAPRHGVRSTYDKWSCRCVACSAWHLLADQASGGPR